MMMHIGLYPFAVALMNLSTVAERTSDVPVDDNQLDKQGQPIAKLVPTDYQVALSQAKAAFEQAKARLVQSQAQLIQAVAQLKEAQVQAEAAKAQ